MRRPPEAQIFAPVFRAFGGRARFSGPAVTSRAVTLRVYENTSLVRATLEGPGEGRVLVVDGGGGLSCAPLGDQLAELGARNGWAGVILHGRVRDTAQLASRPAHRHPGAGPAHPRRSGKADAGERDVTLTFAGVTVRPGAGVHADEDGILTL